MRPISNGDDAPQTVGMIVIEISAPFKRQWLVNAGAMGVVCLFRRSARRRVDFKRDVVAVVNVCVALRLYQITGSRLSNPTNLGLLFFEM